MDKFVARTKQLYQERQINREKQWPPCHSDKLIRLQLVERESYTANHVRDRTFSRQTYDIFTSSYSKQTPLAYGDLFKVERGKRPVRKVLVEGDAGIGKTTLCTSVSEDWANGKLFEEFELVFLLPLRHKKVASIGSLSELIKPLHPSASVCSSVTNYLEEKGGENVLIIADGWDELGKFEISNESFLHDLLFGEILPFASVVLTSRPSASAPLHQMPCFDRFIKICGFNKDNIREYIQSEFSSDQAKACHLVKQLEGNPLIESVCSVPLNCVIVCYLWHTLEEALPSTMTELYTKIILNVILRNIRKMDAFKNVLNLPNFDALPEGLQQSWMLLCRFAFQAIEKNQLVFSEEELVTFFPQGLALDESILCFGLLQSTELIGCGVSFHFLHKTFQEYLAALHLVKQPLDTQLEVFQSELFMLSHYSIVCRFFFGISFCQPNVEECSKCYVRLLWIIHYGSILERGCLDLSVCHCVYESKNGVSLYDVTQYINKRALSFSPCNAHDCAAVLNFFSVMQECSSPVRVIFRIKGIREDQIRTFVDVLARRQKEFKITHLQLSGNNITISHLFHRASGTFQSLERLDLSDGKIGAQSINSIAAALPYRNKLSHLDLSHNPLGVSGVQALEKATRAGILTFLVSLSLRGSLTNDTDTNGMLLLTLVEIFRTHCPYLRDLDLSGNNLGVPGATALGKTLSQYTQYKNPHSQWLSEPGIILNNTSLGDEGLIAFVDSVEDLCLLNLMNIPSNDIHGSGASYLADSISSGKIMICGEVSGFMIDDNPLGLQGTVAVGRILSSSNVHLEHLSMGTCQLTTIGGDVPNVGSEGNNVTGESVIDVGQQLCQMTQNTTVVSLYLNGNRFTGEGIHILASLMHLCPCLRILFSGDCGITSRDLKWLLNRLTDLKSSSPSGYSLHYWELGNNEIDDSGMSTLMDHQPSLFPCLDPGDIRLGNNPVSGELRRRLRLKVKSYAV